MKDQLFWALFQASGSVDAYLAYKGADNSLLNIAETEFGQEPDPPGL